MIKQRIIYKYQITPPMTSIEVPSDAEVLCVGVQKNSVMVWISFNPLVKADCILEFHPIPTGQMFDAHRLSYTGTVFVDDLVFHIYHRVLRMKE